MMEGTQISKGHPYSPHDLHLPGYVPCFLSLSDILSVFSLSSLLLITLIYIFSGRLKKTKVDRVLMCWWTFTGLTHIIFEGYIVFSPDFFKDKTGFYLAEVWKEYSKGDSRFAGRNVAVVAFEGITAILVGPTCLLAVYAIASEKSYSYILQFAICLGQTYGNAVYYITAMLEGNNFSASSFYYHAYFIGANIPWIVIPWIVAIHCWRKICAAFLVQVQTKKPKVR